MSDRRYDYWILPDGKVKTDKQMYSLFPGDDPVYQESRLVSVPAEIVEYLVFDDGT
jgi:hypothetical protein